ncbi:hypothetical protein GCM10025868_13490 [Angustibacter aerolatus]|uniref:Uncharacterized protein n=1 Tax=Angustibacter aerolatus TaxID=1162965 RepID=A0ABQ6JE70_9ACTN|nr:hypothetical protein GCM10025868_13490 [Angustibacter aerolatus]
MPCTVGAKRRAMLRTPRSAYDSVRFSVPPRIAVGPSKGERSSSVASRPEASPAAPDASSSGRSEPSRLVEERLDSLPLRAVRAHRVGEVVLVGQVQHGVGGCGPGAQAVEVVEVASPHARAGSDEPLGRGAGPGQALDLVTGGEQPARPRRSRSNRMLR